MSTSHKVRFFAKLTAGVVLVPSVPVLVWWKSARQLREERTRAVHTKVRVPNVQTVDDLMVEKCQPGDVLLFDRKCDTCASSPLAALACWLSKQVLCDNDKHYTGKTVDTGSYEHCGIVVPGHATTKAQALDPSNLLLLEATAGSGVVARPLLTRLEMSQSRSVLLLPLATPGEGRNQQLPVNDNHPSAAATVKSARTQERVAKHLSRFRDKWCDESDQQGYAGAHASLSLLGCLAYACGLQHTSPIPTSPAAWLVVSALQQAGAAEHVQDRTALETKVEDFLRDGRFHETDTVRLRPGFKFLPPVALRETSSS